MPTQHYLDSHFCIFHAHLIFISRIWDIWTAFCILHKCWECLSVYLSSNLLQDSWKLLILVFDIYVFDQVTIARVYNWDVHQRRIQQAAAPTAQE